MRKKVVSVLLTAAMTATMLAGCGNKQTADSQLWGKLRGNYGCSAE